MARTSKYPSVDTAQHALSDFTVRHLEIKIYGIYIDDGYTGTNFDRPLFQKMMEAVAARRVNCIIVKDLSRFGRNYIETGKYLETVFPLLKTRFVSVNDNVDSFENPSSMNSVMIPFKNVMNDEFCRDISVKVRSSLTVKRKQGQFIGSFAPYGYIKDPNDRHKLIIDEEAAQTVRLIYKMFTEGKSVNRLGRYLNDMNIKNIAEYKKSKGFKYRPGGRAETTGYWSDYAVRRILTNRVYVGDIVQKKTEIVSYKVRVCRSVPVSDWITVKNMHEPIVSKELFDRVQALLARDTRTSPHKRELSLLAGFVKCADCRRAMQKKSISQPYKLYYYYVCSTYRKMTRAQCTKHTIRSDALEKAVLTTIQKQVELAVDMDSLIEQINNSPNRNVSSDRLRRAIASNGREREKIKKILLDLYPDYKSGLIDKEQYLALKDRYDVQCADIDKALVKLNDELEKEKSGIDGTNAFILNFKKFKAMTVLTREILVELVNNIYVHEGGGIDIDFKFGDAFAQAAEYIENNRCLSSVAESKMPATA